MASPFSKEIKELWSNRKIGPSKKHRAAWSKLRDKLTLMGKYITPQELQKILLEFVRTGPSSELSILANEVDEAIKANTLTPTMCRLLAERIRQISLGK
jgi:hypothetical protein